MKDHLAKRPTGAAATVSAALVVIANKLGAGFSPEEAAIVVGGIATLVSVFCPRLD